MVRRLAEPELGADCGRCPTWDAESRRRRGCEGPTADAPLYGSTCPRCWGNLPRSGAVCGRCNGAGIVLHHRCPGPASRGLEEFANAWSDLRERHLLPAPGVMRDQTAWFVLATRAADAELAAIRAEQQEKDRRAADKAKAHQSASGGGRRRRG